MAASTTSRIRNFRPARRGKLAVGALALAGAGLAGWTALHHVDGLAPLAADTARAVVGDRAVTRAEEIAYRVEDRVQRAAHEGEAPTAHWQVEPRSQVAQRPETDTPEFRPADVGPMYAAQAAPGDGAWVPIGAVPGVAYRTLLHPDADRSYAELFVAAIDLSRVDLRIAPGTMEPENVAEGAAELPRTGRVPDDALGSLFAAFNGGFKTRHGHFGMRTEGVTLVPAKNGTCTVARYEDGTVRIGTWETLPEHSAIDWFRQTPGCMVEGGVVNPKLHESKGWGATLDGDTVIRRSAIGLSADAKTLFVAISNATQAEALARGMQHAGAAVVAQLDVNYSYPRLLFYADSAEGKVITPVAQGFVVRPGHYVTRASKRDFFYMTVEPSESLAKSEALPAPRG